MTFQDGTNIEKQGLTELEVRKLATRIDEADFASLKSASTISALSLTVDIANATTLTTAMALCNSLKTKMNSVIDKVDDVIAKLKTANIIS